MPSDSPDRAARPPSGQRPLRLSHQSLEHLAVSVVLAAVGYITTALHTLRAQQHRARVDRVNEQLKALYGPLLACVTASKSAYVAMLDQAASRHQDHLAHNQNSFSPKEFAAACRADPQGAVAETHRRWVREVLLPLSERAARTIMERADLLEGSEISPLLLQLVAHVSAYRVILRRWEEGDYQRSAIPYPDELKQWASESFDMLKQRQSALLGIAPDGSQGSPLMQLIASKL